MSTSNKTIPMTLIISLLSGAVFTVGLIVSGMVNPEKVLGFLRLFHGWDPSLGLVMGGGIAVAMPTFFYVKSRIAKGERALDKGNFDLPTATKITPQLAIGSLIFGIGWGMLGFCPAPVLVTAFAGYIESMIFVVAMLAGFWLHAKFIKS